METTSIEPERRAFAGLPSGALLGHLSDFRNDRAGLLLRVARVAPEAARMRFGVLHAVVISCPELAYEVLQTRAPSFMKSPGLNIFLRPLLGDGLLTSEGETHARQRRLLAPAFAHRRVASYARTMAERGAHAVEALEDGQVIDVADAMMRVTLEIVGKTLFDTEVGADADEVGDALTTAMEVSMAQLGSVVPVPPYLPTPLNLKSRRAVRRLDAILYRIIGERRAEGGDRGDLLSILLSARDENGASMSDAQVRDEAMTLFLAGHETTANALSWTLYLLGQNPEARSRVEAEIDALGRVPSYDDLERLPFTLAVLKESMRLYPPAYLLGRQATESVTIGGRPLRRGSLLMINVLGIHRRADLYPDPERFDPERFLGGREKALPRCAYMPFGAGPRVCIGNHFALMEGHLLLAAMLRRVRFELLSDVPPAFEPLVTLRPRGGLPMRVAVREPSGPS
jgi:cytochrome P450